MLIVNCIERYLIMLHQTSRTTYQSLDLAVCKERIKIAHRKAESGDWRRPLPPKHIKALSCLRPKDAESVIHEGHQMMALACTEAHLQSVMKRKNAASVLLIAPSTTRIRPPTNEVAKATAVAGITTAVALFKRNHPYNGLKTVIRQLEVEDPQDEHDAEADRMDIETLPGGNCVELNRAFIAELKKAGYDGVMSVEFHMEDGVPGIHSHAASLFRFKDPETDEDYLVLVELLSSKHNVICIPADTVVEHGGAEFSWELDSPFAKFRTHRGEEFYITAEPPTNADDLINDAYLQGFGKFSSRNFAFQETVNETKYSAVAKLRSKPYEFCIQVGQGKSAKRKTIEIDKWQAGALKWPGDDWDADDVEALTITQEQVDACFLRIQQSHDYLVAKHNKISEANTTQYHSRHFEQNFAYIAI